MLYETYRGARRVIACSAQAEALGIAPGMPLAEAMAISTQPEAEVGSRKAESGKRKAESGRVECKVQSAKCKVQNENPVTSPNSSFIIHHSSFSPRPSPLTPFPSDPLADREALEELAAWCQQFSPIVGIEDSPLPESLLLDVTGLEHLFGGEGPLAQKIVDDFRTHRGLTVRVAIADTLGAAWAVARFCNSSLVVPPGQTLPALRGLPIEALRLPAQVVEMLHSLGVYRIGQLEPLPRAELAARFGASIALRWDQATGQAAEPIPASPLPAELQARESLEYPTARRDAVELVLQQLIGQVAQKLLGCGRGAMRLQCRLECSPNASRRENMPPTTRHPSPATNPSSPATRHPPPAVDLSVGLFEPTASAQHLFQLVRLQLERLSIPAPVVGISVEVSATAPLVCRQESLFADGPDRAPSGRAPSEGWSRSMVGWSRPRLLAGLVDRLASRLGRHCVLRPRLIPDAQPESAYQYEPLIANSPLSRRQRAGIRNNGQIPMTNDQGLKTDVPQSFGHWSLVIEPSPHSSFIIHHSSFPLRLFRSPLALSAMSVMPEGPPLRFSFRGQEHCTARAWGPERIETGWWRGRSIARDYYRIETTAGRRFWLFRRLNDGRWFLHGTFE